MKKIFVSIFMCLSLITFSQKKDSTYTLLDFYKNNWAQDSVTGKYYEKHDLDSFSKVYKSLKMEETAFNGFTIEEIKQIFGEPQEVHKWSNRMNETFVDYFYYGSQDYFGKGKRTFGTIQFEFDEKTNKVRFFDRHHPTSVQE